VRYDVFFKDGELSLNSGILSEDIDSGLIPLSDNVIRDFVRIRVDLVKSTEDRQEEINGQWIWASDVSPNLIGEL